MSVKAFASSTYVIQASDIEDTTDISYVKSVKLATGEFELTDEHGDVQEYKSFGGAQMACIAIYRGLAYDQCRYMFGVIPISMLGSKEGAAGVS